MKSLPNLSIANKRVEVLWLTWDAGLVDLNLSAPGKQTCPKFQNPAITQITVSQSPREMLSSGTSTAALKRYKRPGGVPLGGAVTCIWSVSRWVWQEERTAARSAGGLWSSHPACCPHHAGHLVEKRC